MGIQEKVVEIRDKLKPVKELVAIFVFFVGGAIFALSYFITRSAFEAEIDRVNAELLAANARLTQEVASLQCKLISHVSILSFHDAQNKVFSLRPPIIQRISAIEIKLKEGEATQEDIIALKEMEATLEQYDGDLQTRKSKRDEAWDVMVGRGC